MSGQNSWDVVEILVWWLMQLKRTGATGFHVESNDDGFHVIPQKLHTPEERGIIHGNRG